MDTGSISFFLKMVFVLLANITSHPMKSTGSLGQELQEIIQFANQTINQDMIVLLELVEEKTAPDKHYI